jgi:hypothetical protein
MPLTDTSMPVESPAGREWKPIPEDVYQVVVKDVEEKIMKKFQSEEEEAYYHFKFIILDGLDDAKDAMVSTFCTRKWFAGNQRTKPSKLVNLVKALYAFYYPKLSVIELEADDMNVGVINDLIGKQLRITVKLNDDKTNNKITEFMAIKKELAVPETLNVADVPKKHLATPKSTDATNEESSDTGDLPF